LDPLIKRLLFLPRKQWAGCKGNDFVGFKINSLDAICKGMDAAREKAMAAERMGRIGVALER
jgi:hypothetical protein